MQEGLARSKSMSVEQTHELKDTITADYFVPGHEERTTTALFKRTRKELIEREGGRCFVTNMTAEELGAPLQAHHHPVERCFATAWDWPRFAEDCKRGLWGPHAQAFDWDSFLFGRSVRPVHLCRRYDRERSVARRRATHWQG
jgi:hypothetical protein